MDQIFNDLSASGCYADKYAASVGVERMLKLSAKLGDCGFSKVVRVVEGFSQLLLAPNYTMLQWATDRKVGANRDMQRQLLSAATSAPYVEKFIADAEEVALVEFLYQNQPALGLGLAYLWESFALGLDGDVRFTGGSVDIQVHQIYDDTETTETVSVCSVSDSTQADTACEKLSSSQIAMIMNGKQLVEMLPTLFPCLACAPSAVKQLDALKGAEQFFREIIRHLHILCDTMQEWTGGDYDPKGLTWSSESASTMAQFASSREFRCQDDVVRQFPLHTKMMSANQRIHYFPSTEDKVVHIGYVGRHLPTTRYRT